MCATMGGCSLPPHDAVIGLLELREPQLERRLLQIALAIVGLVAILFGLTGVLFGTSLSGMSFSVTIEGYVRFIKAVLVAVGLIYWSAIPHIEKRGERISIVTFILVCGAAARLATVIGHGFPTVGLLISLIGELVVVPMIWLWLRHLVRRGAVA